MHTAEFEELAGRIDALSHALLHVAAELELVQVIDGPRLSRAWCGRRMDSQGSDLRKQAALQVLGQLSGLLDEARANRLARRSAQPFSGSHAHHG